MPPENLNHRPESTAFTLAALKAKLKLTRLDLRREAIAQAQFAQALEHCRLPYSAEWIIPDTRLRIDFMIPTLEGPLGVEMKVDGSAAAITRQVLKYAQAHPFVAIVLVTTVPRQWPMDSLPTEYSPTPTPLHIIEQRNL